MQVSKLLLWASKKLSSAKIENSRFEAEFLLSFALELSREKLIMDPALEVSKEKQDLFEKLLERRALHEPMAHLTESKEFFGLDFIVSKDTLVPRPETEMMVEEALEIAGFATSPLLISDLGTGSGCIAVSVAKNIEKEDASFTASDISKGALKICKQNLMRHDLEKKIQLFEGSLLEPVFESGLLENKKSFLVLANLPYLSEEVYEGSPKTVKEFEPKSALFSEEAGLWHYREFLTQLVGIKKNNPQLQIFALLEISPEQKDAISKLILEFFPKEKASFQIKKDLAGKWRLVRVEIF